MPKNSSRTTIASPECGPSRECTIASLLAAGACALPWSGSARLDAQLLLSHVLGCSRSWLLAHDSDPVHEHQRHAYGALIGERATGVPIAYLRGHTEWFGMKLAVTRDVLIPRPETELVLEEALDLARARRAKTILDVGTGSGAIAIGLAHGLPEVRVVAIDTSFAALEVARENASSHGVRSSIVFERGSLLEPVTEVPDLIVANLPYLSDVMMRELPRDVQYEPPDALRGGKSGLDLYESLLTQVRDRNWLVPVIIEIDPRQTELVRALVAQCLPDSICRIARDYAGHDRIVVVEQ